MDKETLSAFASIGIGLLGGVALTVYPWPISNEIRHIIFWISCSGILLGTLLLVDVYYLSAAKRLKRFGVPTITGVVFVAILLVVEWPAPRPAPIATNSNLFPPASATESNIKPCPASNIYISNGTFSGGKVGISMDDSTKLCGSNLNFQHVGTAIQVRPDQPTNPAASPPQAPAPQ